MLDDIGIDALRELASIGAGHAATALSQLVDRKVVISCPELKVIPTAEVAFALGGPEVVVAATYVRLLGDARGALLFVVDGDSARALAGLLVGGGAPAELTSAAHDLLRNAGHVLLSAFVSALGRTTGLTLMPGPPAYAYDMAGAILATVAAETEGHADEAVFADAGFVEEEERSVSGSLFFLPAEGTLELIVGSLWSG